MKTLSCVALLLLAGLLRADPVVVVSATSAVDTLTRDEARQVFNGQTHRIGGATIKPLDLPSASQHRQSFYQQLMGKSADQMKSYWARMIFTGRGMPPREVSSTREMEMLVGSNRHFIGYLDAEKVTAELKVVYRP